MKVSGSVLAESHRLQDRKPRGNRTESGNYFIVNFRPHIWLIFWSIISGLADNEGPLSVTLCMGRQSYCRLWSFSCQIVRYCGKQTYTPIQMYSFTYTGMPKKCIHILRDVIYVNVYTFFFGNPWGCQKMYTHLKSFFGTLGGAKKFIHIFKRCYLCKCVYVFWATLGGTKKCIHIWRDFFWHPRGAPKKYTHFKRCYLCKCTHIWRDFFWHPRGRQKKYTHFKRCYLCKCVYVFWHPLYIHTEMFVTFSWTISKSYTVHPCLQYTECNTQTTLYIERHLNPYKIPNFHLSDKWRLPLVQCHWVWLIYHIQMFHPPRHHTTIKEARCITLSYKASSILKDNKGAERWVWHKFIRWRTECVGRPGAWNVL